VPQELKAVKNIDYQHYRRGKKHPPPLRLQFQSELKPRIPNESGLFSFYRLPKYSK